ncbi:MAG: GGDEF domain-containing protein, partial [Pseudomonadota bacterium]
AAAVALVDATPWLASKGDLLRWDTARGLEPVPEADRPPVAVIDFTFRTLVGEDGSTWAASFHGVAQRRQDGWHPARIAAFRRGAFSWLGPARNGGTWIGATGALYRHDPGSGIEAPPPGVKLRAVALTSEDRSERLATDTAVTRIQGYRPTLDFAFALPTASIPAASSYRTRLLGHEDERWRDWSADDTARYPALAPGTYRFEVEARTGLGAATPGASWAFVVEPGFLESRLGRTLGVLGISLLGFALAAALGRWRTRALKRRNVALDALVGARTRDLEAANRRLAALADRDGLTGIANRRRFESRLAEAWRDGRERLALLMVDADHFKAYNDEHGHVAGDELLRLLATEINTFAATVDGEAARYGGEEFAVILAVDDRNELRDVAEALRQRIADASPVTASIGGTRAGADDASPDAMIERADGALYEAKADGRNCVRIARR